MNSTGYILNGKYYSGLPDLNELKDKRNTTEKLHERDRQREQHGRDLLQPYVNGKPNPAFVEQYPEEATKYGFIKE